MSYEALVYLVIGLCGALLVSLTTYCVGLRRLGRLNSALRAETARRNESLNLLDTFFQFCPIGLTVLDTQFRFLRVNDSLARANGASPAEHLDRTLADRFPTAWAALEPELRELVRTGRSFDKEIQAELPNGSGKPRHWLTGFFPVRDTRGHLVGIGGFFSEVTELRRMEIELREWNERFNVAEEAANVSTWEWDPKTDRIVASARCKTMLGFDEREIADNVDAWVALIHPDDRQRTFAVWREAIKNGESHFEGEYRLQRKDGGYQWVLSRGRIEQDAQGLARLIGATIDLSEKKETENRLRTMTQELKKSNTELERFAYVASHDLKEPLRMITTYLGLLSRELGTELSPKQQSFMGYALDGAKRLNSLVDALLRFSRIGGADKLDCQPVPLSRLVDEVRESLQTVIAESNAHFEIGPLPTVFGDRSHLSQLFQNLLSNALKFRKSGETPRISISGEDDDGEWVVKVADNGLGIQESDQTRIFEIFRRLHRRADYPGDGIGLAACKKIVESHGGKIWVTSEPGNGSTFHFTLGAVKRGASVAHNLQN